MSNPPLSNGPRPEWDIASLAAEMRAGKAAHEGIPNWPLDRPTLPLEGPEDLDRLRAAGVMAGLALREGMRRKEELEKVSDNLAGTLSGFGVRGMSSHGLLAMAKMNDPFLEACQTALKLLLMAPGAPESWSEGVPGGGTALDFLPEGKAKSALVALAVSKAVNASASEPSFADARAAGAEKPKPRRARL